MIQGQIAAATLRAAVEGLGRERVGNVVTLRYITDRSLLLERLTAIVSGFFGSVVVLLAGVGLFGLLSQAVAQRRKEIGIRMAVGAAPGRVVGDVVRDALTVTLAGVGVGIPVALATVQVVETLLFGVGPHDPLTLALAVIALTITAVVASAVPALRASRIDPLIALRAQ